MQKFAALALLAVVAPEVMAQKNHGKADVDCKAQHAHMGVGGRCVCAKGYKMQRLQANAEGLHEECVLASMFNPEPQCPQGHECGRECFDGKDNDGDGQKDCQDKDCQFDPRARGHCLAEAEFGRHRNEYGQLECSVAPGPNGQPSEAEEELKRIERYCCPGGKCDAVPDTCPGRCSRVFVPFWRDCGAALKTKQQVLGADLIKGIEEFYPKCVRAEQEIIRNRQQGHQDHNEVCTYANYLTVALDCASYIDGSEKLTFGDTRFCHTKCFEKVFQFQEFCSARMTEIEKLGLSTILPFTQQCEHMVVRPGDGTDAHVRCDVQRTNQMLEADCGKNINEICGGRCSMAVKRMSNVCAADPLLVKYKQVEEKCGDYEEDAQCKAITGHYTTLFQHNCCGKDKCAKGLPNTCSAACADSFLPFYSRCGSSQYGKDLPHYDQMNKFAGTCAETKGHTPLSPPGGGGALPHVPGPNPEDPCDAVKTCGLCKGICGWCRHEATQSQLAGTFAHQGWCSSKCETTRGECGRGLPGGGH